MGWYTPITTYRRDILNQPKKASVSWGPLEWLAEAKSINAIIIFIILTWGHMLFQSKAMVMKKLLVDDI